MGEPAPAHRASPSPFLIQGGPWGESPAPSLSPPGVRHHRPLPAGPHAGSSQLGSWHPPTQTLPGPPIPSYLMLLWLPLPASVPPTSFSLSPSRSRSFSPCSRWSSSWWGRLRSEGPGEAAGCTSPFRLMSLAERCRGRGEAKPLGPASRRRFA